MRPHFPLALLPVLALAACDEAKSAYERCVELKASRQLMAAERACAAAVRAEADSPYAKRAATKLAQIKAARAREAKRAAEARAERVRLLGAEPEAGSAWLPASEQQLADWRQLLEKHHGSSEAREAARRLERQTSVCRHYVAGSPYGFNEYTAELDKLAFSTQQAFNAWHYTEGGESLLAMARTSKSAIEQQRDRLSALCESIGAHPERDGEALIKRSLVKDCTKIKSYAARLHGLLDEADSAEVLAIQFMVTWPELSERREVLTRILEANEAKRAAGCEALPRRAAAASAVEAAPACIEHGACASDKTHAAGGSQAVDVAGPLAVKDSPHATRPR